MRILIVDDSKAMRSIVRRTIAAVGPEIAFEEASNGAEALTKIQASAPGLVVADWNMPEMTGIELLKALRAGGSDVKLGFVTSEGTDSMKAEALQAGACFFLCKPFSNETLQDAVKPLLG
jgi:two-component system chemotaxis response regulator CheY